MSILLVLIQISTIACMQITKPWTNKHWCKSVTSPEWPFAYSKYKNQKEETKGRVSSNEQDMRHMCQHRGVSSKCHICEDFECGDDVVGNDGSSKTRATCHYQLQGVSWEEMSVNIPTITDVPWAVNGLHRYDFGGNLTSHVCLFLSATYPCQSSFGNDYSHCRVRCWGYYDPGDTDKTTGYSVSKVESMPLSRIHVNTTPWMVPSPRVSWSYPKKFDGSDNITSSSTPQGRTLTIAGHPKTQGFIDGTGSNARFHHPEGVAIDHEGYIFVADTGNHAIRMISPFGNNIVTTIAGTGEPGSTDGLASAGVQFSSPSDVSIWFNGTKSLVLFVADTGNHRIRKITADVSQDHSSPGKDYKERLLSNIFVECISGRCGQTPEPGYADNYYDDDHDDNSITSSSNARFDSPQGLYVTSDRRILVADTNNHLIRMIYLNGTTRTLAGSLSISETTLTGHILPGCPSPCLKGVPGFTDGHRLLNASFHFPSDIVIIENEPDVIYVTDRHHLRRIDLVLDEVITLAGSNAEGERDGHNTEATFHNPESIAVTSDGILYIADASTCKIRRVTPPHTLAIPVKCGDDLSSIVRPSGCASYNPPTDDRVGLKYSSLQGNIHYNYHYRHLESIQAGHDYVGRSIKDCVGVPPLHIIDKQKWDNISEYYPYNQNLIIDDEIYYIREDPNEGTLIRIRCPANCDYTSLLPVYGGGNLFSFDNDYDGDGSSGNNSSFGLYGEESSICGAAIHAGVIDITAGGILNVILRKNIYAYNSTYMTGSFKHNILSQSIQMSHQLFTIVAIPSHKHVTVQTIAGAPVSFLEEPCGYKDSIPTQEALFDVPSGLGVFVNASSLDHEKHLLIIADRNNHVIRSMSATCSFPCENGGKCVGPDICSCSRWKGVDCTQPVCDGTTCGDRKICTGPNVCSCIPGYKGINCDIPTCVQSCRNGGYCSTPDTCTCAYGWFDSNCTTPVCTMTCGNGGNCTSPNKCSCPEEFTGEDCRLPVCQQSCLNGGFCVAPNTCLCPPQWSSYDCSAPVCHQGFFVPYTTDSKKDETTDKSMASHSPSSFWLEYKTCNFTEWCRETNTFDCLQTSKVFHKIDIPYGPESRYKTGRRDNESLFQTCALLEIEKDAITLFSYLLSRNGSKTDYFRYSPTTPFEGTSQRKENWNPFVRPKQGYTQPWKYSIDRQLALVELYNVSLGYYACANGGLCSSPDTCACEKGWVGFDCRTPVCEQGYYEPNQKEFVRGTNTKNELKTFERFMGKNATYRLDPYKGYSNPKVTSWWEKFVNSASIERFEMLMGEVPYKFLNGSDQGGYSCSIRSVSEWEDYRCGFILENANFYSRYMNMKVEADGNQYTHWKDMGWPATHKKSQVVLIDGDEFLSHALSNEELQSILNERNSLGEVNGRKVENITYLYTDEGYRIYGIWSKTGEKWTKGSCIVEFQRICSTDTSKGIDLEATSNHLGLLVQDTDLSFRPRIAHNDQNTFATGRWFQAGGECVDHVVRGCFNNSTCIQSNKCQCADGWSGHACDIPICSQSCLNHGNCTHPNVCTCEKGWRGYRCNAPICAQECNNKGTCVAPDTCQCEVWENIWRDGRVGAGHPIFKQPNGDPQLTGWTGYDCSVPICTQAERFRLNINVQKYTLAELVKVVVALGAKDNIQNEHENIIIRNNGKSFQTGCGFDPFDTGCCLEIVNEEMDEGFSYRCFTCDSKSLFVKEHDLQPCSTDSLKVVEYDSVKSMPFRLLNSNGSPALCGRYHNPGKNVRDEYYSSSIPGADPLLNNENWRSNVTSNRFLCNRFEWDQGDFIDNEKFANETGSTGMIGVDFTLNKGPHVRVNYINYIQDKEHLDKWTIGKSIPGEGVYECFNQGSCIAPDVCACADGFGGYDCAKPICRHKQVSGKIVGCLNGGVCINIDECHCVQTLSVLWQIDDMEVRDYTGFTGSDCSIPICFQGYFDPLCNNSIFAAGGEGCYRCPNDGICVAPDTCQCQQGWSGYNCKTPVCKAVADAKLRSQLSTVDEEKILIFESDPCGMVGFYKPNVINGVEYSRGNCTTANKCTCLCKKNYNNPLCKLFGGDYCKIPYQDPFFRYRNILAPNEIFGTRDCYSGYEGFVNSDDDSFGSCHLTIYEPTYFEGNYIGVIAWSTAGTLVCFIWILIRRSKKKKEIKLNQIERRKHWRELQDRDSEMTHTTAHRNNQDEGGTAVNFDRARTSALTHRTSTRQGRPGTGGNFSRISAFAHRTTTPARVRPETGGGLSTISALTHRTTTATSKQQVEENSGPLKRE